MKIAFYNNHNLVAGYLDNPDDLERVVPDGDTSNFYFKDEDVSSWQKENAIKEIKKEAQRRMMVLLNARDPEHLSIIISNSIREGLSLEHVRLGTPDPESDGWLVEPQEWTQEQKVRALELKQANNAIDHIREASNNIEVMDPIPADYKDDKYWI